MSEFKYIPYTYFIYHNPTGYFYYGCKYGKYANPELFWNINYKKGYFTSSKIVKELINEYGYDSFDAEVDMIFDNADDAIIYEKKCIKQIINMPKCLNGNIGGIPDINNNTRKVIINGESSYSKAGKKISKYLNSIDPETGLTFGKLNGISLSKYLNSIDPETGLSNAKIMSLNYWNNLSIEEREHIYQTKSMRMKGINNIIHIPGVKDSVISSLEEYYKSDKWLSNKDTIIQKIKQTFKEIGFSEKHSAWMIENNPATNTEWYNDGIKNYRLCHNDPIIKDKNLFKGRLSFKIVRTEMKCDICGKVGKGPNMKRYHFNNCKSKGK